MYSYVTEELLQLINAHFPVDLQRMPIFGHSMGGHRALICALKNPGKYKSVSAFAPICNPVLCPWGKNKKTKQKKKTKKPNPLVDIWEQIKVNGRFMMLPIL